MAVIFKIDNAARGVITDAAPEELDAGAWSDGLNVRFRGGFAERAPGMAQIFDLPTVTPYFVAPFRTSVGQLWLHAGLQKVFVDDGTTRTDVGRVAVYTGTTSDRWTGGAFNGLFILNNGVDVPQSWTGAVASKFANLAAWPAGHLCKAMRPFRNQLIAMNLTKTGPLRFPFRVLWSAIADPGTTPPDWDITGATGREAGEIDVAGAAGPLVDGLQFGDVFLIYTTGSTHVMRYVGGQNVMDIVPIKGGRGALGRNCIADTPLGHVVLTNGDIVLQADGPPRSIADARIRRRVFETLDNTNAERVAFVVANPADNEALVCYPTDGSATCNRAAVWNWADDSWSFRELRSVTAGGTGQTPQAVGLRWSTATATWDTAAGNWGGGFAGVNDQHLVLAHALPALSLVGYGNDDVGVVPTATIERTGMHLGEPQRWKTVRAVWPRIDAPAGTVVNVEVGASPSPDVAPTWKPAVPYTVGTSSKVNVFATGRFLALRLSNTAAAPWRVRGIDLDVQLGGAW